MDYYDDYAPVFPELADTFDAVSHFWLPDGVSWVQFDKKEDDGTDRAKLYGVTYRFIETWTVDFFGKKITLPKRVHKGGAAFAEIGVQRDDVAYVFLTNRQGQDLRVWFSKGKLVTVDKPRLSTH